MSTSDTGKGGFPRLVRYPGARPQDMDIYTAILGRAPQIVPPDPKPADQPRPLREVVRELSPQTIVPEIRRTVLQAFMKQRNRPQVADFIRRLTQSAVRQVAGDRTPTGERKVVRATVIDTAEARPMPRPIPRPFEKAA